MASIAEKSASLRVLASDLDRAFIANDYKMMQTYAARIKKLAQSIKAQARSTEMRQCKHVPRDIGYRTLDQGFEVTVYDCAKCGKGSVKREVVE